MSHCNALLKNYWLGPFKDEKEMKFVQNSYAKAFFHPKNVYDNPKISWRNCVTLYDTGPLSHCTALLKNYRLGLLKDKKEMKFVQNSCAEVFFHPKNVYNNPQISWRTYVTLYATGPLSHCTAIADF